MAGLGALVVGAEVMVRGSARAASRLGISPIVVGLTVVSIGTSMPELAVGVVAAVEGAAAHWRLATSQEPTSSTCCSCSASAH